MDIQELQTSIVSEIADFRKHVDGRINATEKRIDNLQARAERPASGDGPQGLTMALNSKMLRRPDQKLADAVTEELPDGIKASDLDLGRIFKGVALGDWKGAEAERRVLTHKALGETPDTAGGYTLGDTMGATILDLARPVSTFIRAGAHTMAIPSGRHSLPQLTQDPAGQWKAENAPGTFGDMLFGRINLNPKTFVVLVKGSIELFEDSSAIEGFINQTFASAIASGIDRVAYLGNGTSEPLGVWNTPGIGSVAGGGALTDYSKFLDAAQRVYEANYPGDYSGLSVVMPPRTKTALAKIVTGISGDKTPLVPPQEYRDMKKFATTQASITLGAGSNESMVLLGDFSQSVVAVRTNITLEATRVGAQGTNSAFTDMQVWLRAYIRADIATIRPAFFAKITGVTN